MQSKLQTGPYHGHSAEVHLDAPLRAEDGFVKIFLQTYVSPLYLYFPPFLSVPSLERPPLYLPSPHLPTPFFEFKKNKKEREKIELEKTVHELDSSLPNK
jgi:hypothetical protein